MAVTRGGAQKPPILYWIVLGERCSVRYAQPPVYHDHVWMDEQEKFPRSFPSAQEAEDVFKAAFVDKDFPFRKKRSQASYEDAVLAMQNRHHQEMLKLQEFDPALYMRLMAQERHHEARR